MHNPVHGAEHEREEAGLETRSIVQLERGRWRAGGDRLDKTQGIIPSRLIAIVEASFQVGRGKHRAVLRWRIRQRGKRGVQCRRGIRQSIMAGDAWGTVAALWDWRCISVVAGVIEGSTDGIDVPRRAARVKRIKAPRGGCSTVTSCSPTCGTRKKANAYLISLFLQYSTRNSPRIAQRRARCYETPLSHPACS